MLTHVPGGHSGAVLCGKRELTGIPGNRALIPGLVYRTRVGVAASRPCFFFITVQRDFQRNNAVNGPTSRLGRHPRKSGRVGGYVSL